MIDYKALFGSTSSCECAHCRSVLGPAAYLVDVLHDSLTEGQRSVLFDRYRRPDLAHVELSCENTETALPYIDLVNEVLENAISPLTFSLQADYTGDLNKRALSDDLRKEFAANSFALSPSAAISIPNGKSGWTLRDQGMRYTIAGSPVQAVTGTPQTL